MPPDRPEIVGGPPFKLNIPNLNIQIPRKLGLAIAAVFIAFVLGLIFINMAFTYVRPNELAIKQVKIGMNTGIKEKIYTPGFVFRIPGMEVIHRFPQQIQVLDLSDRIDRGMPSRYRDPMAKIQTSDGFFVDVDVSILYRITDPYKVIMQLGKGEAYLHTGIIPKVQPTLKETLGELTTEEFYNSPMRVAKALKAKNILNDELEPMGLFVEQVLVRFFSYSPEIQKNIEEKKLQDQLVFKNMAEARAAIEQAVVKKVSEEGEANVSVMLEEGNAYKVTVDAERDLYVRSKRAEADLLVTLAEAKRTELKNEAMEAKGADRAVALEMAKVLRGIDVVILPSGPGGLNPLDLDQVVSLFGVQRTQAGIAADGSSQLLETAQGVSENQRRVATVEED